MATYYRTGVETYSIIGTADEMSDIPGGEERILDGSTYFAVDENMFYTFYDGQWYETLPEAARLYHDDVGTDTKPIKLVGGVATVVANELAEDSKVVHKTGNETVGGAKTFTSDPFFEGTNYPVIKLRSKAQHDVNNQKAEIRVLDQKNEADSIVGSISMNTSTDFNRARIVIFTPDRSSSYTFEVRAYADHELLTGTPYLHVDINGNPQVLPGTAVMFSSNITVDPRIVHTTGTETIAGTKTFTGGLNGWATDWHRTWASSMTVGQYCIFAKITPVDVGHFRCVEFIQGSNTVPEEGMLVLKDLASTPLPMWVYRTRQGVGNSALSATSVVVLSDGTYLYLAWKKESTYGNLVARESMHVSYGVTQSMTSSPIEFYAQADMPVLSNLDGYTVFEVRDKVVDTTTLASDTTVVHTTGNETIAGTKTFTSVAKLDGGRACRRVSGTIPAGKCMRLYNVTTYTMRALLHIVNTNLMTTFPSRTLVSVGSSTLGGYKDLRYPVRIARFSDYCEIWIQNDTETSFPLVCDIEYGYSNLPAADGTVADALPEVGTGGCTEIYDLGAWQ